MELVHTCTKYGYMQAHTSDMRDLEQISPNNTNYRNSVDLTKLDQESHVMRVTCIIILIILQRTHKILHISYQIVHIIFSYAMRLWNHGLYIRISQNEGLTYGTSIREPSLENIESASFIRTYFIFIRSQSSVNTSNTQDVV